MKQFKQKIFLCSTNDAEELAQKIFNSLSSSAHDVFWDKKSLLAGSSIPTVHRNEISQSEHIICLVSSEWDKSEYLKGILQQAASQDISAQKRKIIPLIIGGPFELPDVISAHSLYYIDFSDWEKNYKNLIKKLRSAIAKNDSLEKIQADQSAKIKNLPMLPWASAIKSASFDFLLPDLYVEPSINAHKHPSTGLLKDLLKKCGQYRNIILTGIPGSGKTTTLRSLFLSSISNTTTDTLALYFTAKEIIASRSKM
jgi:DNA replication protein DnaC